MGNLYQHSITIEIVEGGYVLSYPSDIGLNSTNTGAMYVQKREVFTSSRKMNQRIKEVLEAISTTAVDAE